MSVSSSDIRERYQECLVCFDEYDEDRKVPRILPCNHTYCSSCLRSLLCSKHIKCPQCKTNHKINSHSDLPKDNTRRDLKEFLGEFQGKGYQTCGCCQDTNPAQIHCKTCRQYLCIDCFKGKHQNEQHICQEFTEICNKEFVPNKFNNCLLPGHEKSRFTYFRKAGHQLKPMCATCVLEENKTIIGKLYISSQKILDQKQVLVDKQQEKLASKENAINTEILHIEFFIEYVNSRTEYLNRRADDIRSKNINRTSCNIHKIYGRIKNASEKDKRVLNAKLKDLKDKKYRIKEYSTFLNCLPNIQDAVIFQELYVYIEQIVERICKISLECFHSDPTSELNKCSVIINHMEKEIQRQERYRRLISAAVDFVSQMVRYWITLAQPSNAVFMLIFDLLLILVLILLPPSKYPFKGNIAFPDIEFHSTALSPSLEVCDNKRTLSFNKHGFRMFNGATANVTLHQKLSNSFTFRVRYSLASLAENTDIFSMTFANLTKSGVDLDQSLMDSENTWLLGGIAYGDKVKYFYIGTQTKTDTRLKNALAFSEVEKGKVYTYDLTVYSNPAKKSIFVNILGTSRTFLFDNVNFDTNLQPAFRIPFEKNLNVSILILSKRLKFDVNSVHPLCWISEDRKRLEKPPIVHSSINILKSPIHSLQNVLTKLKYTGVLANILILPNSNIFYVVDIDYNNTSLFDPSLPLFEIGLLHQSWKDRQKESKSIVKSISGYSCSEFWPFSHCFKPKTCAECVKSLPTTRIFVHIINDTVRFYNFPFFQEISVFHIQFPAVPFVGLFIPERELKLTVRSGDNIRLYEVLAIESRTT